MVIQIRKRKHPHLLQVAVVSSIIFLFFVNGCQHKPHNSSTYTYLDYNFFTQKGISEINQENIEEYKKTKKHYVQISYKDNIIDSIIIFNLTTSPFYIKTFVGNDAALYEINKHDDIYGNRKSFLVVRKRELEHYIFITPVVYADNTMDCQVIKMTEDTSIRINCLVKQSDTANFSKKLIAGEYINKLYQRLDTLGMSKKLTKKLTLVSYFKM